MIEIALYQPDIAPNAATIARLCACLGIRLTIIEPAGFVVTDSAWRRAGLDYLDKVEIRHSASWQRFSAEFAARRIILLTTKAAGTLYEFSFNPDDVLLFGRESAGVPDDVHNAASARVKIPLKSGLRSLNIAVSCAMAAGEALRQTQQLP